ncbi:Ig-like domain-containing protein [Mucilaginibacter pedocola]|uniref:Uncharacterized protein n=1 Tax=Mucilaginibacter pedocola TaxID=1792845 RepID=A0A1S9PHT5_9SPHI|nr:Ig-like domain-containing protein [Mucilaginibacter pedocola]OOQ60510.1 hypothetical protein BC343_24780 [Mucilaginibacter pedocola]
MRKLFVLPLLLFVACTPKPQPNTISISLAPNKKSLQFEGVDAGIVGEISRDSVGEGWQTLVPVYRMPADTELKSYQPVQPGKYVVADSTVVFTPDTPFAAGQTYFVRWYHFDEGKKASDYLKGRQRPGQQHFTDLIFKQ